MFYIFFLISVQIGKNDIRQSTGFWFNEQWIANYNKFNSKPELNKLFAKLLFYFSLLKTPMPLYCLNVLSIKIIWVLWTFQTTRIQKIIKVIVNLTE